MRSPRIGLHGLIAPTAIALTGVAAPSCRESHPSATPAAAATASLTPVADQQRLPNAHVVTDKVIAGAEPEGDASFAALRDLGVKTIISVDGATPDVETAGKYGMRYVHLPIAYATVTREQGLAIAKAIDELPGRIYVHCHHGKHRSAAAVAVACVYNGRLPPDRAEAVLKTFGTGANYAGLWKAAREARPVDPRELEALDVAFPETTALPPLAEAMVLVDRHADHLTRIQRVGWRPPPDHPDLDPVHEALQLQQRLHAIAATDAAAKPDDFREMLADAENAARALRESLAGAPPDNAAADAALQRMTASCTACHRLYRD